MAQSKAFNLWGIGFSGVEIKFLCAVGIGLLIVTSVPYLYGYLTAPADQWFSGVIYNVHDTAQYFSWMRESGHALFIENKLTAEPNRPIYLNLHWWIPGRLAAILGLSLSQAYQIFRLVALPLLMVAVYAFCAALFTDRARRRFAFLLCTFTSGLGWIWVVEKQFTGTLEFPLDVYTTPGNSFYVMMVSPPQALATALTLFVLFLAFLGLWRKRWRFSLGAGLLALFLGMGHIYDLVTVWAVLGVFGLLVTLRDGWSWRTFWRLAVVVLISASSALYWGWVSSDANPMWKQALAQYDNLGVFTPDPAHLLILLGLTFIIALTTFDGVVPLRRQTDQQLFVKGWFGVTLLLIYLPFRFRIMLLTGYQLPMAVLATWGLFDHVIPWLEERLTGVRWRRLLSRGHLARWGTALFLLAVLPTNLYLLAWRVVDLSQHDYPFYLHRHEVEAIRWLEENTDPDDVVLSSFTIGYYIPGLAGNRAFLSNAVMTMDSYRKQEMVEDFFSPTTSDVEREKMLRQYGVRYVFRGPAERELGTYDLAQSPLFVEVFSSGDVQIYAVKSEGMK